MVFRTWQQAASVLERFFESNQSNHRGVHDRRSPIIMFAARSISALLAFTALLYGLSLTTHPKTSSTSTSSFVSSHLLSIAVNGTLVKAADGTEIVLQRASNPKGAILFFHGCSHSATDFFTSNPNCPQCIGLPEELHLVRLALYRNLSPIALSSTNRARKCWRSNANAVGDDYDRVASALEVATAYGAYIPSSPLFAVGASSGGHFATSIRPPRFKVSATHSIVAASGASRTSNLPHAFTHMAQRDDRTATNVRNDIKALQERGVPVIEFSLTPLRVTLDFLQRAFPSWDGQLVTDVRQALVNGGFIDRAGNLYNDPRRSDWRKAVRGLATKMGDSLVPDQSQLSEELNRAWGAHEMTADHFDEILDFFMKHCS